MSTMGPIEQDLRVSYRKMKDSVQRAERISGWVARWKHVEDPVAVRLHRGPLRLVPFRPEVEREECCSNGKIAS